MSRNAYVAVAAFELRRRLRDPLTLGGMIGFAVILGIGAWFYWSSLPPRPRNARLFGEAYLLATMIAWHAGLAADRMSKFDVYLTANFVSARTLYFAKISVALVCVAAFSLLAFVLAVAASAGDFAYAAHYTGLFLLAAIFALPAIVLIELVLNTRHPIPILVVLFFTALALVSKFGDVQQLISRLGMGGTIGPVGATVRSAAALVVAVAMDPLFRLRLGGRQLAALVDPP